MLSFNNLLQCYVNFMYLMMAEIRNFAVFTFIQFANVRPVYIATTNLLLRRDPNQLTL